MVFPGEPLSILEKWKNKSYEISRESKDSLASLLANGIQSMVIVFNKESSQENVESALASLERERSLSMFSDQNKDDVVRSLVYGHIESLIFILNEFNKERHQMKESEEMFTQTEEVSNSIEIPKEPFQANFLNDEDLSMILKYEIDDQMEIKIEEIINETVDTQLFDPNMASDRDALRNENNEGRDQSEDTQLFDPDIASDRDALRNENNEGRDQSEDDFDNEMVIKNEGMINDTVDTQLFDPDIGSDRDAFNDEDNEGRDQSENAFENDNELSTNDLNADNMLGEQGETDEISNCPIRNTKDSSEAVEVDKKRRSSRIISKTVKYTESSDEWDGDSEPNMKKTKLESTKMKKKNSTRTCDKMDKSSKELALKRNATDLECSECEFRTTSISSFTSHLRRTHSTTVALAGLALRCDCGFEGVSYFHSLTCEIANFTVIRKREGPIRTINEAKTTPQCVLCENYPKTACGYIQHLKVHHQSSLLSNGIYLLCSCGVKYSHSHPDSQHTAECNPREFALHQLADK